VNVAKEELATVVDAPVENAPLDETTPQIRESPGIVHPPTMDDMTALFDTGTTRKFMDGKMTPKEVFQKYELRGRKCYGCGNPKGAILIRVFMPLNEAWKRAPEFLARASMWAAEQGVERIPTVDFGTPGNTEPYIRISEKVACADCQATAEKAAAHGPSWCVVEIKRGPSNINPMVRVAKELRKG